MDDDIFSQIQLALSYSPQPKVLVETEAIESANQFFRWFATIESDMQRSANSNLLFNLLLLSRKRDSLLFTLDKFAAASSQLLELNNLYLDISSKSIHLQSSCEKLLNQQSQLSELLSQLSQKLAYFNQLDPISRYLSQDDLPLDDFFIANIEKLDHCLAFIESHLSYRDAELYKMRFSQCMARALNLIKTQVSNVFRSLVAQIREKLKQKSIKEVLNPGLSNSLFYGKFKDVSDEVSVLINHLESRCNVKEYNNLLQECISQYFSCRKMLLTNQIYAKLAEMNSDNVQEFVCFINLVVKWRCVSRDYM